MYIDNFISYIRDVRRYSLRTCDSYLFNLNDFNKFLSSCNTTLDTAVAKDVSNYIMFLMEKGLKPTSVNQHLASIRSYYDYCCRFEDVCYNPAAGARDVRTPKRLPSFIPAQSLNFLIDKMLPKYDYKRMRTRIIILIFYHCGVRCNELSTLLDSNVSLQHNYIKVLGKGNKERLIPFGQELHDEISYYLRLRASIDESRGDCLIRTIHGENCTNFQIRRICKIALLRIVPANLAHPHVLRHSFATALMNNGASIEVVKLLLGHASVKTTAIYQHTSISFLLNSYKNAFK